MSTEPPIAPASVPMVPMTSPCNMKMRRMLAAEQPMVLRMAMSRVFSITSSTSDAMMLRAATITMRPIVIDMAIFSSQSAEKSDLFRSAQSCASYSCPRRPGIACATCAAAKKSSTFSSIKSGRTRSSNRSATLRCTNPYELSYSKSPRLNTPTTLNARFRGDTPKGVRLPSGVITSRLSPRLTPSLAAKSLPSTMPGRDPRPGSARPGCRPSSTPRRWSPCARAPDPPP